MEHVEYCEDDSSSLVLEGGAQVSNGGSLILLLEGGEEGAEEFNFCSVVVRCARSLDFRDSDSLLEGDKEPVPRDVGRPL
jgi:hypothetical protein